MSSYRNYVPWKSSVSLPSSSSPYKSGYTSRDETTTTPKFGSISSTTAYRPSYSGGTYKSVPVKKESSGQYTTGSRYSSSVQDDKEKEKEKNKSLTSDSSLGKSQSSTSGQKKYDGTLSNKENASSLKSSGSTRGSTSNLSVSATSVADRLSKLGRRSRDPSPAGKYELHRPSTTSLSATSRIRSRDPSPVMVNALRGRLSRETSPVSDRRTTNIMTRVRSREPSPAYSSLRGRSRDPSPSSTSISGLSTPSSYRLNSRLTTTSGYGPKYSSNTSLTRAEKTALSYMSSSDMRARSSVRQSERREKKTIPTSITSSSSATHSSEILGSKSSRSHSIDTNRTSRKDNFPEKDTVRNTPTVEPETLVSISVTTRATSPTPPGSSVMSSSRLRRTEIAKTIEKTIQRPLRKRHTCVDKQIQSDRLDDSTKYSRFSGASTRISSIPWSPSTSLENKYLRYSSGSVALTSGGSSTSLASAASSSNLNKTSSQEISSRKDEESSELRSATKLPSKQTVNKQKSPQKHKSSESSSSRSLPPAIPKAESPTKVVTTTSSNAVSSGTNGSKWLNKDFRKSALNIGPTDRPRKSRTPSVGTDSEERNDHVSNKGSGSQIQQRIERSPSVSSETSSDSRNNSSVTSSRSSDSENSRKVIHKHRCVQPQPQQQQRQMGQQKRQPLKSKLKSSQSSSTEKSEETNSTAKSKSNADNSGVYNKNESVGNSGDNNTQFVRENNVAISNNKVSTTGDSSQYNENSTEKSTKSTTPPSSSISTASSLIRKLGFVSNFFAQRSQDPNSEAIYLDKSSSNTSNPIKENPQQHPPEGAPFDSSVSTNDSTIAVASSGAANSSNDTKTTATAATNSNSKLSSKNSKSIESDPDSSSWWLNTSQQIDTESALDIKDNEMRYKIRHIDSGETAWWLKNDEDDTVAEDLKTYVQDDSISDKSSYDMMKVFNGEDRTEGRTEQNSEWDQNNSSKNSSSLNQVKNSKTSSSNDWWFGENYVEKEKEKSSGKDENDEKNVAEIERSLSKSNSNKSKSSWKSSSSKNVNNLNEKSTQDNEKSENSQKIDKQDHSPWWMLGPTKKLFHLRPIESGERAWWLQDDEKSSKSTDPLPNGKKLPTNDEETDDENDIDDEKEELVNITKNVAMQNYLDQPPLGDRASPEGLEDTSQERKSPYDNVPRRKSGASLHQQNKAPIRDMDTKAGGNHFISRHRNIDELLGGSMRPLSPLMDCFLDKSAFLEEVTPSQVRIHDSTARMPHIQRMGKDECDCSGSALERNIYPQVELDDAALQVYKDGDYGAYLDLESSLAEQAEEIEGLNSSRKNSLVVRTQLSVRVHSIIEKLLSSEGSELRRALFSLKQIFQEDKDLVHGFVALGGLNCLVRVGNGADQNYQNYILRALGQVLLYVDGMNGVMKHGPTIQWLYSLIASKYRLVVKTALKLLLVFVEYVESNCYLLVNAIHNVDNAQGTLPWSNIMRLLKDYENADTELLIYATSLINKTLSGLSDQDSFYDESDLLEQQGMEAVIQRYMSRPGTDLDLLDQLQLYEAVLKFEDGETDAIRLPDNSIRKTLRCRTSTDSKERRKSRRHSTGTSPSINQNPIAMKKPTPPPPPPPPLPGHLYQQQHPSIEEDSSSSSNNSISGGVFRECRGHREGAGVTPGLRRRRERAERQKNFMKEQEAAAANGLRQSFGSKDELNGLESENEDKKLLLQLKRDHTVKDLTQKLSSLPTSPQEDKPQNRIGDMTGLISKAKEGLAKSKSKGEISRSPSVDQDLKKAEQKKSENELHWEELVRNISRPLILCDLDFNDLKSDDDLDITAPRGLGGTVPPPPPPMGIMGGPPPPTNLLPPPTNLVPLPGFNAPNRNKLNDSESNTNSIKKNKKTVKLFWKEVREDLIPASCGKTIWDELPKADVDIQKLEHLFESRAKDLLTKEKQQEMNKNKEIIVLDHKRSNAINIAMTKLPPPRAIKAAILKMDATVVTREGIDKLLNMLPTEEERGKIQEAQMSNPELPLGSAEQFLLTLSSISELAARLKLWAFKLDFENIEREITEPLMDLKQGLELLKANKTFKCILSTLLSVGIFLNGAPVKGFQIEYLSKVPEVKDTVHKHSLLHHLCHMVMESSPDTTDLYSEIGPITRASKADFTELAHNLVQLETECKASWDRLKLIAKHDCPPQMKQKLVDFLADCAERIILLQIVHKRVVNRYKKFLLWLGVPQHRVAESKPNEFCRILSEFALEYRTTRERVHQQIEKKANHRERNKTRGKMIIDVAKFRSQEDRADAELKQLLGSPTPDMENTDGTLTWRRRRAENLRSTIMKQSEENFTDGDDEILESLVKTATKAPGHRSTPRERKRTRHADRKSLKRSRTREGFTVERIAASPEH